MLPGLLLRRVASRWLAAAMVCAAACVFLLASARGHPVAPGSLDLLLSQTGARAVLRISNEQIFIAGALGEGAAEARDFDTLLARHGAYLLRHITFLADGKVVPGEVVAVEPPADRTVAGFTHYTLRYPWPGPPPPSVELKQDLLTEILFAPGNPWEAPIVARIRHENGGVPIVEGALWTARQPLRFTLAAPADTGPQRVLIDYLRAGLAHIAVGWDHVLFVAALVLALPGFWRIVALVSVFTLAHTVTFALTVLGIIHIRSSVVEPLVAASIVVAAALNVFRPAHALLGCRLAVAFGFGLFHGLGFAGGMAAAMHDYSARAIAGAIAGFSLGVELGHQIVVLPLLGVLAIVRHSAPTRLGAVVRGVGIAILAAGTYLLCTTLW